MIRTSPPRGSSRNVLARHAAAGGGAFTLGVTQAEAAEGLGTVREVLVRALRALRDAGLVAPVARGRYCVRDAAGLRRLAGA